MNSSSIQYKLDEKTKKQAEKKGEEDQRYGKLTLFRLTQVNKSQSICFSSTPNHIHIDRHWNVYLCRLKNQ